MREDLLEVYKKAIQQQFEKEKNGLYSSYLIQNSRAKLRQLCIERFKGNNQINDLNAFKIFFGFEFGEGNLNKLKSETDRFRTIENFFKKSSDTNDLATLDLAAILVDFIPRPFLKFGKEYSQIDELVIEKKTNEIIISSEDKVVSKETLGAVNKSYKKKIVYGMLGFFGLFSLGYTAKDLVFHEKQCMQWQNDHYELLDCNNEMERLYASAPIIPIDIDVQELNRIKVSDSTIFFKAGKPIIWYCKVDGKPEFFDRPGFHPVNGKTLKPITEYIINKYILKE